MGDIPSTSNQPSAKFSFPTNMANIEPNTPFVITMNIANLDTGNFVNAESNYFAAPQQLSSSGQVIGHTHFVVESLSSLTQTTPTDPTKFAFFKGVNEAAVDGSVNANVTAGLPAGTYKVSSINTAANHQPVLGPVAQHGSFDDVVYVRAKKKHYISLRFVFADLYLSFYIVHCRWRLQVDFDLWKQGGRSWLFFRFCLLCFRFRRQQERQG
jgi:hypothetical protein